MENSLEIYGGYRVKRVLVSRQLLVTELPGIVTRIS